MEIESRIRDRAYAIWEAAGRPEGCAVDHWLAAEAKPRARVRRAASSTDGAATKRPARKTKTTAAADSR